ncbi:cholecystokinin receptor-like [Mizuhopecten yessoensis]|uniref:cholecystokinin receptor-like n=1 Tax=Mizuhopecten yessoensis TaxID=6573 RepID=UPI000B45C990|nr:cholecystokinin receptor-like [Mizuhopecten yessoensis]
MTVDNVTELTSLETEFSWNALNSDVDRSLLPVTVILGFYLLVGVIGNFLVVFIYVFRWEAPKTDHFFVPILAVLDMSACLVSAGVGIYANMNIVKFRSDVLCKTVAFLGIFFVKMSGDLLSIIAFDRYLKINKPFDDQMSFRWKKISVVIMSITGLLMAIPSLFTYGTIPLQHPGTGDRGCLCANSNTPHHNHISLEWSLKVCYQFVMLVDVLARFVGLVICYFHIGKQLYKHSKTRIQRRLQQGQNTLTRPSCVNEQDEEPRQERDSLVTNGNITRETTPLPLVRLSRQSSKFDCQRVRLTLIFMLITVIYIITMGPKLVIMIADAVQERFWTIEPTPKLGIMRFLYTLFILNNVVNPFIYGFFDRRFRRELYRLFTSCRN